jgi:hypothetical protein
MTMLGRLLACLTLLVPGLAWGGNGGSTYSRFGLGDIRYGYSAQSLGMGGTGVAVRSSSAIDPLNPAGWGAISRTRYAIGALYEGWSVSDGSSSTFLSSAEFNGAMIAVPVSPSNGIVLAFGITPYSRVNYHAVDTTASLGGLDYTLRFRGSGGLSAAHAGLSFSVSEEFQVGAKVQYYFGTIRHIVGQEFATSDYSNASVERSTQFRGVGGTFGIIYTGLSRSLGLEENARFGIGAFLSTGSKLTATQDDFLTYVNGGVTTRDTATVAEGSVRLPVAYGFGLSYATDRLVLAADIQSQNWDDFTVDGVHPQEIRNSVRMSAGVEFLPKREPGLPYGQRLSYRAGTFYHQTYYRVKNEPINEFGLSGGVSLPITGETRLHIGAEYAMRGTTDLQLQKDNILRLSFTVTGGELWFTRPSEE